MTPFSLADHVALVTGSSQGIGLALARGMEAAGARVVYHGNRHKPTDLSAAASFLSVDLSAPDAPAHLIDAATAIDPAIDILVCNAGSFFDVSFLEMTLEAWSRTLDLNVRSVYFLCQAFARHLVAASRSGSIVIVSSTNGFQSEDNSTAYDTSKGALVMLTRTLAQALAPHGIRVNGLAPGLVRTPLTAGWMEANPEMCRHYEKKILLGRIGEAADCAGAAVFLASEAARYITGQVLVVDGGLTVGQIGRP